MRTRVAVLVTVLLCVAAPASARLMVFGGWTQVGADAQHTGASSDTTFPPSAVLTMRVGGQLQGPFARSVLPAITSDLVYAPFSNASFGISAIDTYSPNILVGEPGPTASAFYTTPAAVDDEPVVNEIGHQLWAVAENGRLLSYRAGCGAPPCPDALADIPLGSCPVACTASPVIDGNTLVAVTSDGSVGAFRANCSHAACNPLWQASLGTGVQSTPTVGNGFVYIGTASGVSVFPLDCHPTHGSVCTPAWRITSGDARADTVAYDPVTGIAFWNSADGTLYGSYGCTSGVCTPQFAVPLGAGPVRSRPVIADGNGFVIDNIPSGMIRAWKLGCTPLSGCTMTRAWTVTLLDATGDGTPSIADGVVWIGDRAGFIYALNVAGCSAPNCDPINAVSASWQLAPGAANGMSTEVADGVVWAASDSYVNGESAPTSALLTGLVLR